MDNKLTLYQARQLAEVVNAPVGPYRRVGRYIEATGEIIAGTARAIGTDTGLLDFNSDVRDQFLRVTSDSGFDFFWPIRELMEEIVSGYFVPNYSG